MKRKNSLIFKIRSIIRIVAAITALVFAVNYIFNLNIFIFRAFFTQFAYLYFLLLLFTPQVFLYYSFSGKTHDSYIPFYDIFLSLLTFSCFLYFALHGLDMTTKGWSFLAPQFPTTIAIVSWFLILETIRRTCGLLMFCFTFFFSFFPIFTDYMPGFLLGQDFSFITTARYHLMSSCSMVGIPIYVTATLLFGFIVFGALLKSCGAAKFFLDLALSLFGYTRGGPAKVSIISSGLFGSLSGDVSANVISTGSVTIPAMKDSGFPSHVAGAVEACASTGGVLMPPVMGAAAFLIASFLNIPYLHVAAAAAIPAFLYYYSLYVSLDFYSAARGMKGISRQKLLVFRKVIINGWYYIFSLIVLIFFLLVLRETSRAPFYTCLMLIVVTMFKRNNRFNIKSFLLFIGTLGDYFVSLIPIMAAAGLIMGALSVTGVAQAMSSEILALAGDNLMLLLFAGFFTSFILGTGMTITACYIFLAVAIVPALVKFGLDPLASHLFVMYCGMISFITPPVAIGAFVASTIANASFLKTAFTAMKLGIIMYFLPFFFVINPALILHGSLIEIIQTFITALLGIIMLAAGIQGYIFVMGRIKIVIRILCLVTGILLCYPEIKTDIIGLLIGFFVFLPSIIEWIYIRKKGNLVKN